ncbi:hypothetical protein [Streptomyces noursei]|uniref:hypothetical protein n=1 Tax=Streptomyces noursei TaxID=1971 RepID=UPI003556A480
MQAAELFAQQVEPPEVTRRLRVSVKSAYQWQQGGADALLLRGTSGAGAVCHRPAGATSASRTRQASPVGRPQDVAGASALRGHR